tara:strand:- start:2069 stop:2320 length:252 start_codon:yes stop_codon:yes gene_type:complete
MGNKLLQIHNESFATALKAIVKPTTEAGGTDASVLIVLESTITAVLLHLYPDHTRAASMLEEGIVPGVIQRLADHAAKQRGQS